MHVFKNSNENSSSVANKASSNHTMPQREALRVINIGHGVCFAAAPILM